MKVKQVKLTRLVVAFLCAQFLVIPIFSTVPIAHAAGSISISGRATITNSNGYLDFNASPYNSNVTADKSTRVFSGYAWSEDVGWVAFGTTDNPDGPVSMNAGTGLLSGKARIMETGQDLDFNASPRGSNVVMNINTGQLSGYAWSDDIGWLNFTGVEAAGYDTVAPPNPTVTAKDSSGGSTTLMTDHWYNYTAPSFSWSAPTDVADTGNGEVASGIAGYYIYWGTSNTADPITAGVWQTGTTYTSGLTLATGSTYYLRVVTKDNAGNKVDAATLFTYKFDSAASSNPAFVSVSPAGYSSRNNYTFIWPSSGTSMAQDTGYPTTGSGVAGYQYKTGATTGDYSTWSASLTENQVTLENAAYQEGANVLYLRTVDAAGNLTSPITVTFYYAGESPSEPQNLTVTPTTTENSPTSSNSFSFSWDEPATFNGSIKQYRYSVNELPASTNTQTTSATTLAAGPFATRQGKNTLYLVAEDEAGNVNYNAPASANFYAITAAPVTPTGLQTIDASNRDASDYAVTVKWLAPTTVATGFAGYEVYRSIDGSEFSLVGTTTGTSYVDESLSSQKYYYYLKAKDNAGQRSAATGTVSITPTGKYTKPPKMTDGPSVIAKAFMATIDWQTERLAFSFIEYGAVKDKVGKEKGGDTVGQLDQTMKHSVTLKGLDPETTYYYQAVWVDPDGNQGRSTIAAFQTAPRPKISDVVVSNITLTSATLSWTTTTVATSQVNFGPTVNYGGSVTDQSAAQTTQHTVLLQNLSDSTTYHVQIMGTDIDGQKLVSDDYSFATLTRPVIQNLRFESVKDAPSSTLKFSWKTNVPASSVVIYKDTFTNQTHAKAKADLITDHEIVVGNLTDNTTYQLQAKSVDGYGNIVLSDNNTFTTPYDTRPPKVNNLRVEIRSNGVGTAQKASVIVYWDTDEMSSSQVEYGVGISAETYSGTSKEDVALTQNHTVIVSDLEPSKIYHLRVVSKDKAGNNGTSEDTTAITGKMQKSVVDIILNSLQRSFGFLNKLQLFAPKSH